MHFHFGMTLRGAAAAGAAVDGDGERKWGRRRDGVTGDGGGITYVNFFIRHSHAKRLVGAVAATYQDSMLMDALYPFAFLREPPAHVIQLRPDL